MQPQRILMVVEDDADFAKVLLRSFERRGYEVHHASSLESMQDQLPGLLPTHAVVDMKLQGSASGLLCVQYLHAHNTAMRIVVLTGFASIATAVEAVKLGACQYLAKPSNSDDIEAAFAHEAGQQPVKLSARSTSIKTLEWERIHQVLAECDFNISEAARRLGLHRRTLARKLAKQPVK